MRVSSVIARTLKTFGVERAFGMPGGEVLSVLDGFREHGIDFLLVKHENSGGYMAQAVYQRTRRPSVLLSTLGPGVTNAVNVVASASQDRIPLVVLTGCLDPLERVSHQHQVLDHGSVLRDLCKASVTLEDGETESDIAMQVDRLMHIALDGRRGPVHMDIPVSLAAKEVGASEFLRCRGWGGGVEGRVVPEEGEALEEARNWLREAKNPLVVIGNDVVVEGSSREVREIVESLEIPVLTSYQAKGVVSDDYEMMVGSFALSPSADKWLTPFVSGADVVLLLGFDPIEVRLSWQDAWSPLRQKVIGLSRSPNFHYNHFESRSFVCDIGSGLKVLSRGCEGCGRGTWSGGEVSLTREGLRKEFGRESSWGAGAVIDELRGLVPRDTVLSIDTGAHRIVADQVWETYEPQTVLQSQGLGSMACGLPLGIGVALSEKDRVSLVMTGDAGLLMCVGELGTLKDRGLKVIIVVFVDDSLALIEVKQKRMQLAGYGVKLGGGYDYVKLAESFGGHGFSVSDRAGLRKAVERAMSLSEFSLIACKVDSDEYGEVL